jgi:hypothetical protein
LPVSTGGSDASVCVPIATGMLPGGQPGTRCVSVARAAELRETIEDGEAHARGKVVISV